MITLTYKFKNRVESFKYLIVLMNQIWQSSQNTYKLMTASINDSLKEDIFKTSSNGVFSLPDSAVKLVLSSYMSILH